jgi:hypothetical protein
LADPTTRLDPTDAAGPDPATVDPGPTDGGADLGRRRFFRQFAGELASTAATMVGAAQAIQRTSAELAGAILDPTRTAVDDATGSAPAGDGAAATGPAFRTSFRIDGGTIFLVDQRALPRAVVEQPAVSAAEVTYAIRNGRRSAWPSPRIASGRRARTPGERPFAVPRTRCATSRRRTPASPGRSGG